MGLVERLGPFTNLSTVEQFLCGLVFTPVPPSILFRLAIASKLGYPCC